MKRHLMYLYRLVLMAEDFAAAGNWEKVEEIARVVARNC